jgi:NAD(P)-dependent dehydrogenase (short-subunit alcohol dehydrogenase family)
MAAGEVVVVGGTSGLGLRLAQTFAGRGTKVVITGRDASRTEQVASDIGGHARAAALDLAEPGGIHEALADVGEVAHVILAAIERDTNSVREFDLAGALRLATLKLVGYTEVLHALCDRMHDDSSVLLFGGLAKDRPYPGSTTVTSVNGAVTTMVRTFAIELAPIRVNAIHPGIVGDTPYWEGNDAMLDAVKARTPTGRLVKTEDVVGASLFLLENPAVNGVNLPLDGGWIMM